jgi:hypothetical protein
MLAFWQWLISDGGAGWVFGVAGLISFIISWIRRARPPKVVVQVIEEVSLVDIHPSQRHRITIAYRNDQGDQEVTQSLHQKVLVIYNNGTSDILVPVSFTLRLHRPDRKFFHLVSDDVKIDAQNYTDDLTKPYTDVRIDLPYLNSFNEHKHFLKLYLISENEINVELINAQGKGWSALFVPRDKVAPEYMQKQSIARGLLLAGMYASLVLGLVLVLYILVHSRISTVGEIYGTFIVLALAFPAPLIIYAVVLRLFESRIRRVTFSRQASIERFK